MAGDAHPPKVDEMKVMMMACLSVRVWVFCLTLDGEYCSVQCYMMGPHPIGIARRKYWPPGSPLAGYKVSRSRTT